MKRLMFAIIGLITLALISINLWNYREKAEFAQVHRVMVKMRDGVTLYTRVWRPVVGSTFPVVLERGYQAGFERHARAFAHAGYVYVGQKSRGSLQGNMFFPDANDGYDSLDWISRQAWCNGKIAMYGRSFYGATQWLVAPDQHPNLKAIIPQNVNADLWERCYWDHGALQLAHTARRIYDVAGGKKIEEFGGWEKFHRYLPLIDLDKAIGARNELWRKYITHSRYDDFWKAISIRDKHHLIHIAVYMMGGWYDNYPGAAFTSYKKLVEHGATEEIRLIINPSDHMNKVVGDRDFGNDADKDELKIAIRWLDYIIKGIDTGIKDEPPISIFVMGRNEWRGEYEWPLERTKYTKFYLHSTGSKDGWLDTEPPVKEPPSRYTYDPKNPVPTLGGNHSSPLIPGVIRAGAEDQRPIAGRPDVLVFSSAPLERDTEVTGPIRVNLYAATDVRDTDFVCRLIDVYPDGRAFNLTEGIIRGRFRESIWEAPKLLVPGKIYEFGIELQPTSNVFKRGHRICLHVTSSSFPLWDRNLNTGHAQGMDAQFRVAEQIIYHDGDRPSHVTLPIIP